VHYWESIERQKAIQLFCPVPLVYRSIRGATQLPGASAAAAFDLQRYSYAFSGLPVQPEASSLASLRQIGGELAYDKLF
jgi:hypothetical protein